MVYELRVCLYEFLCVLFGSGEGGGECVCVFVCHLMSLFLCSWTR